jgi:hypothetical protein
MREVPRDQRWGSTVVNYCCHRVEEPVAVEQEVGGRSWFLVAVEQEVGGSRFRIAAEEVLERPNPTAEQEVGFPSHRVAAEQEVGFPRLQAVVVSPSCQLVGVVPMYYRLDPLDSNFLASLAVVLEAANLAQWRSQRHFRLSFCVGCGRV